MALNINGTTGISGVDGSATAPALQGVDSNTGISFGTDTVNVVTGGSTRTTVNSSGNFGIGTTSPQNLFHCDGGSGNTFLHLTNSTTGTSSGDGSKIGIASGDSGLRIQNQENSYIRFETNGSERMRIDSSGNVSVGGISPSSQSAKFQTRGSSQNATRINMHHEGNSSASISANGGLVFGSDTSNGTTERMKITSAGNVEITNLCVAGAGFSQIDSAPHLISTSSVGISTASYFIGNQQIQTSSDRRLKENIVDTKIDASSELKKVRVVDFTWNDPNDKAINNRNSRGKWTGCIAQEIVDVFPFAVNAPRPEGEEIDHDSEALWGMEYGQLVPVLIKGFQELQAKIETLETEKAKMQTDLTALTARVTALEAA